LETSHVTQYVAYMRLRALRVTTRGVNLLHPAAQREAASDQLLDEWWVLIAILMCMYI